MISDPSHPLYGRGQRLSNERIVELYAELKDAELVGYKAGVSGTTVLNRVRVAGGEIFPPGHSRNRRRRPLPLSAAEVVKLYRDDGLSGPQIAERCGCDASHIYRTLQEAGVPRRRSQEYYQQRRLRVKAGRGL